MVASFGKEKGKTNITTDLKYILMWLTIFLLIVFLAPMVIFYLAFSQGGVFPFMPLPFENFKAMTEKERGTYWHSMAYSAAYKMDVDIDKYAKWNIDKQLRRWEVTFEEVKYYLPKKDREEYYRLVARAESEGWLELPTMIQV